MDLSALQRSAMAWRRTPLVLSFEHMIDFDRVAMRRQLAHTMIEIAVQANAAGLSLTDIAGDVCQQMEGKVAR